MLETPRLLLRPFTRDDVHAFRTLAGEWDVARMTSDIPHPLSPEQAEQWLRPASGETRFAIEHDGLLIGGAGYFPRASGASELGFWLGRTYWGQGFSTEAVRAVVMHGFTDRRAAAFSSSHFADNPASSRVLVKLGFEAVGPGRIWSIARGADVDAMCYWLSLARAEAVLGPMPVAPRPRRWSRILGRIAGRA